MSELDWSALEEATAGIEFDKIKGAIPESYRPTVESVKDIKGLVDGFVNSQKLIGKKEAEYKGELEKLTNELNGFKVSVEDYELKTDKVSLSDDTVKAINGAFAKAKLPKGTAQAVFADLMELQLQQSLTDQRQQEEYYAGQAKERQLQYGDKLPAVQGAIETLVGKLTGGDETLKKGFEVLLKDNSYFAAFSKLAAGVANDDPAGPTDKIIGGSGKTVEQRLKEIQQDPAYLGEFVRVVNGSVVPITDEERIAVKKQASELYALLAKE